jgi:hypothetical protein
VQNIQTHALCDLDVVDQFVIHSKPGGVFSQNGQTNPCSPRTPKNAERRGKGVSF